MTNAAALIAAIAGLITSLTGFLGMIFVVKRTSGKERHDAAEGAAEKVLMPQNPPVDIANTVVEMEGGRDDGPGTAKGRSRRGRRRPR